MEFRLLVFPSVISSKGFPDGRMQELKKERVRTIPQPPIRGYQSSHGQKDGATYPRTLLEGGNPSSLG